MELYPRMNLPCPAVTSPSGNTLFLWLLKRFNLNHVNRLKQYVSYPSPQTDASPKMSKLMTKDHINLAKADVASRKSRWLKDTSLWDRICCFHCTLPFCSLFQIKERVAVWKRTLQLTSTWLLPPCWKEISCESSFFL